MMVTILGCRIKRDKLEAKKVMKFLECVEVFKRSFRVSHQWIIPVLNQQNKKIAGEWWHRWQQQQQLQRPKKNNLDGNFWNDRINSIWLKRVLLLWREILCMILFGSGRVFFSCGCVCVCECCSEFTVKITGEYKEWNLPTWVNIVFCFHSNVECILAHLARQRPNPTSSWTKRNTQKQHI